MHSGGVRGCLSACLATLLLTALTGAAPALAAPRLHPAGSLPSAVRERAEAARIARYWTPARMRSARPLDLAMDGSGAGEQAIGIAATVPATMTVHLNFPRSGLYKVWIEFRGGSRPYSAPFVVQAL